MRKLFVFHIFIFSLAIHFFANAQQKDVGHPEMRFWKTEYNFGQLKQNENAEYTFIFFNTGNEPLIISNVSSTCGCTIPQWDKKPVMPGKHGSIKVKYNTSKKGLFRKIISVKSNDANNNVIILRISGIVK